MKKFLKYFLLIILVAAAAGYFYWQKHKKGIIKDAIESAIKKKTDSLYSIHYDSSRIDEIGGNATFYHVSLQSDSVKKHILASTDSLPEALYFINIDAVKVTGVNVPALLQEEKVTAHRIILDRPIIQVVNTGAEKTKTLTRSDSLQLYERILGKFSSIQADTIEVLNGMVITTDRHGKPLTTIDKINIRLNNFLVDSVHSYQNIVSYFIKDIQLKVGDIQFPESPDSLRINMSGFEYNAAQKKIYIKEVQQYKTGNSDPVIDLRNINITQLSTDAFILFQKLKAGLVTCDGGLVTIYKRPKVKQSANQEIEFATGLVDEIEVKGLNFGNTKIIVKDPGNTGKEPFILNDVRFILENNVNVFNGKSLSDLVANANWQLFSSGFSLTTKDKRYKIITEGIELNNKMSYASVKKLTVKPLLSKQEFSASIKYQEDRYDLQFNNISLTEVDFKKLISENKLEAGYGSLQPIMNIYNDRTVEPNPNSKLGKYPHQLLQKMDFPLYIKKLDIKNALIAYTEKSRLSSIPGTVSFTNVQGVIDNVTNIHERIKDNPFMTVNASGYLLGKGKVNTTWVLPLSAGNANFTATGKLGSMDGRSLDPLIEPLAMASIKQGQLHSVEFSLRGDDYKATGNLKFLYDDLKLELLKKDSDSLKKKGVMSIVANALVKNKSDKADPVSIEQQRDLNRTFFNLLWKSIFTGVKKVAMKTK